MTEEEIRRGLKTKIIGNRILIFDTLESTNSSAKILLEDGAREGTVIISEEQTRGRGRLGRTWLSERGKNLAFSVILKPPVSPENLGLLSLYAGLAVSKAVEESARIKPECKWPNDVLLEGKKISGILSEAVFREGELSGVIIGIGINVNQTVFPEEIKNSATSICLAAGKTFSRVVLLRGVLNRLDSLYDLIIERPLAQITLQWEGYCSMFGKEIRITDRHRIIDGIAVGLTANGELILDTKEERIRVTAGDVSILKT